MKPNPEYPIPFKVHNVAGTSGIVLCCEHASNFMPDFCDGLGLSVEAQASHIAWDIGALGVALQLSKLLDAPLVAATLSRLLYDCNREPSAADAMPKRSEVYAIPGNSRLSAEQKNQRINQIYKPFVQALDEVVLRQGKALITIHSFTPIYNGQPRAVQVGILHDADQRLADAMLNVADQNTNLDVRRNQPYAPVDGVTHTLVKHGIQNNIANVMIEIRNDLLQTTAHQNHMAETLCQWITASKA